VIEDLEQNQLPFFNELVQAGALDGPLGCRIGTLGGGVESALSLREEEAQVGTVDMQGDVELSQTAAELGGELEPHPGANSWEGRVQKSAGQEQRVGRQLTGQGERRWAAT